MSKEYHTQSTQELPCRYLGELLPFLKEVRFCRNTEEERLAYSYPQEPTFMAYHFQSFLVPFFC